MLDADPHPAPPRPDDSAPDAVPLWRAEALTGPGGLARILLGEARYTLRITRAGKLILTK